MNVKKPLHTPKKPLVLPTNQMAILKKASQIKNTSNCFKSKLEKHELYPLKPQSIDTLQINLGKMCNQTCNHCHVDAGPHRKEIMSIETMKQCLAVVKNENIKTIDLTGGAPEMNPNFRWFVENLHAAGANIMVRSNLTIIKANHRYEDLPEFFKKHNIQVVSSLPCYTQENVDAQRGNGVFKKSIEALKALNAVGYGKNNSSLILNLVYNPGGPHLPPNQKLLEKDYKQKMNDDFDISFNNLFTITNVAIARFLDYLEITGKTQEYMQKLIEAFNTEAASNVMCRNLISVGWDGYLYDCDFNQMLEKRVKLSKIHHISNFNYTQLIDRNIALDQHCFACTAGMGSSCSGSLV